MLDLPCDSDRAELVGQKPPRRPRVVSGPERRPLFPAVDHGAEDLLDVVPAALCLESHRENEVPGANLEARLFTNLALHGVLVALAREDLAAGERPRSLEGRPSPEDEQDRTVTAEHDRSHGALRVHRLQLTCSVRA